jgi:uncharacterized Zn finger protein
MICPVCQSDNIKILRTKRGLKSDVRVVRCGECGSYFDSESKITHVINEDISIPIEQATKLLEEKWETFRNKKYSQIRMF